MNSKITAQTEGTPTFAVFGELSSPVEYVAGRGFPEEKSGIVAKKKKKKKAPRRISL